MDQYSLLDSGPLGLACCDPSQSLARQCQDWLDDLEASGFKIRTPAISDYEVRRELIRIGASAKLRRLAILKRRFRLLDISPEALEQAAQFWAVLRRSGRPTSSDESIDGDAILAGIAATSGLPGDEIIVATTNVRHLSRFPGIDARQWDTIV